MKRYRNLMKMEDNEEIIKRIVKLKAAAIKCLEKGELLLACQYLWDANNLLPEKYRAKMPPPPRPEDYPD